MQVKPTYMQRHLINMSLQSLQWMLFHLHPQTCTVYTNLLPPINQLHHLFSLQRCYLMVKFSNRQALFLCLNWVHSIRLHQNQNNFKIEMMSQLPKDIHTKTRRCYPLMDLLIFLNIKIWCLSKIQQRTMIAMKIK